ncbi:hypothetical protein T8T21_19495 (plasmid) [Limimaricola variabilis]|uniref:hypothetical protein n=1 Tax=Limimaricola variabilis TaxID=1492771 RepID=UPI002AC9D0F7|nr:hypothetical protein [Limimaricola variabilis]WPY96877.1 hypothetical protein T8T21_19495 [Limimaricola variabilis]
MSTQPKTTDEEDVEFQQRFIEQAEYLDPENFLELNAEHPDQEVILGKLKAGGAKLLVGPRGCGKTTLMLRAYRELLSSESSSLPIYVNFKLSLKLEPMYINSPNASFWFRTWLGLRVVEGMWNAILESESLRPTDGLPAKGQIADAISSIEGRGDLPQAMLEKYSLSSVVQYIEEYLSETSLKRCVLLLDDAAHAFSPKQQEDFFDFFREIKSRRIAPKAAIYPGITTSSATFHVGHDAEKINVWVKPSGDVYEKFMLELGEKRFGGQFPNVIRESPGVAEFLAYSSFGIPRSYLNMLRAIVEEKDRYTSRDGTLDRRKVFELSRASREMSHNVYDSLSMKLPSYANYIQSGANIYQKIVAEIKEFNRGKDNKSHAVEIGLKKPLSSEIERIVGFLQYSGLLMPSGENSRGVKGTFEIYSVHFGDLITQNAVVGARTKTIPPFLEAFRSKPHQAWPRLSSATLMQLGTLGEHAFDLTLPHCQNCGAERISEHARFCHNCGAQLKSSSLFEELVSQDISALPISATLVKRIKEGSKIKKVRDILTDADKTNLRSVKMIGPIRAQRIAHWAEEHVA